MRGSLLCAKCGYSRTTPGCPRCNHDHVFISLSFKGKRENFWKDNQARPLSFADGAALLIKINREIEAKTFRPAEYRTITIKESMFERAVERWLNFFRDAVQRGRRAPGTQAPYESYTRTYYLPHFKGHDIRSLTTLDLQGFVDALPNTLSPHYQQNIFRGLQTFLRWAKRRGELRELPEWPEVDFIDGHVSRPISYDRQIEGISGIPEKHQAVFLFARECALRIGEVCALQVGDLDLHNRRALIQRTYSKYQIRETTKGGRKEWVPLSEIALDLAREHSAGRIGQAWLFERAPGRGYKPHYMGRLWRRYSGVPNTLYESIRHSTLTDLSAMGANAFEIKDIARHTDIRTSAKYVQGTQARLNNLVNRLGNSQVEEIISKKINKTE